MDFCEFNKNLSKGRNKMLWCINVGNLVITFCVNGQIGNLIQKPHQHWVLVLNPASMVCKMVLCVPVWILTRCSLEVNWSFTVNTWPFSISLDLGSLVRTLCVGFPQARDCRARTSSLSGISVSCWISCYEYSFITKLLQQRQELETFITAILRIIWKCKHGACWGDEDSRVWRTSKVDFSLLLKSMRMVIWKVDTCRMCFLVLEPVTWAPPTPTSDPSSCPYITGSLSKRPTTYKRHSEIQTTNKNPLNYDRKDIFNFKCVKWENTWKYHSV